MSFMQIQVVKDSRIKIITCTNKIIWRNIYDEDDLYFESVP